MTPEQKSRQHIDRQLEQAGWIVQDYRQMNITAGLGVAVREFPLTTGDADYMLSADAKAIGVVEAKPKGHTLTGVETQSGKYLNGFAKRAVVTFLAFDPSHAELAHLLARAVTDHATPVGSGTVARTKRIPVEQRAEAAVIAWMRHQTTGYDGMVIPRVKGYRREMRRILAQRSKELLARYRRGESGNEDCPLKKALAK